MKRLICPKCNKSLCEKTKYGFRKICWSCRINGNPIFKQKNKERDKIRRDKIKYDIINHYGGKCACCGEDTKEFLSIDHINNDGGRHRKSLHSCYKVGGSSFYQWIKNNHFPKDLQILCFNCNCGKQVNGGICPHKDKI